MKIFQYNSYEHYVEEQKKRWQQKHKNKRPKSFYEIELKGINQLSENAKILVNGCRNTHEIECFEEIFKGCKIQGTDIAAGEDDLTARFIKCDFNDLPVELSNFDLIYSNSLDHSFDPVKTITSWCNRLNTNGWLVLVLALNVEASVTDPVEFSSSKIIENLLISLNFKIQVSKKIDDISWVVHAQKI